MQIGSEMATLQEKNPKMDPKKRFFLKNPPGFWTFEKSSLKLTSNRPFWLKQIYRDIKFILRGLPGRCVLQHNLAKLKDLTHMGVCLQFIWRQIMDTIERLTAWDDNFIWELLILFYNQIYSLTCKTMIKFTLCLVKWW